MGRLSTRLPGSARIKMQSSSAIRKAASPPSAIAPAVPEMAATASRLIYSTMGIIADYLLGNGQPQQAQALLARLFQLRKNVFSHELADAVVMDGRPEGLLVSASWRTMERLRLPTAFRVAAIGGFRTLLRLVIRSAPLARAREAEDDEYFVAHLAIAPGLQRRGLGTLLMRHAERKARRLGCTWLALTVATDNRGAVSFYRDLDFGLVGTSKFPALEERIGYAGFHRMRKGLL
jgi:ribosomal protein S18 acetylase RimI-like enzyme